MAKIHVFVYGTLKTGLGNHRVMQEAQGRSLGRARTIQPDFFLIDLGMYPAAVPAKPNQGGVVQGELFELDEKNLAILDGLEGFPNHYDRKEIPIEYGQQVYDKETGEWHFPVCTAWMYFINPAGWLSGRNVDVCEEGVWFPRIRRDDRDISELTDPTYIGAAADCPHRYDVEDFEEDSYYSVYDAPAVQIGVDGDDDLHGYIEQVISDVHNKLSEIEESEDDDVEWDYVELEGEGRHVGIEGIAAAIPVVREALAQHVSLEESD